jgi:hypothetical protein
MQTTPIEHTFFPRTHATFCRIDYILSKKLERAEITCFFKNNV